MAGPGGELWFSSSRGRIFRMSTSGEIVGSFTLPAGTGPYALARDSRDRVWFTSPASGRVGWVDAEGHVVLYAIGATPSSIAAGPDENMWVTVTTPAGRPKIARVTPEGAVAKFRVPGGFTWWEVNEIAAGPEGNLWFTERDGSAIGWITTDGIVTEIPLAPPEFEFIGVATGTDGNVYFPGWENGTLLRATPGGAVEGLGVLGSFPSGGIAAGPDGNIWVGQEEGMLRVRTAAPRTRYVLVEDGFLAPTARLAPLGNTLRWTFFGPNWHRIVDRTGMGLYDSGYRTIVETFTRVFDTAGTWQYGCHIHESERGTIEVPMYVSPVSGGVSTTFGVVWSVAPAAPGGTAYDVQIYRPGAAGWVAWRTGVAYGSGKFTPDAGPGDYRFRARLRKSSTGAASGWSPPAVVTVV